MADDPNKPDRERGNLDQFQGEFGRLADRFEPRADTRFVEQDLPRAEHPQDAAACEHLENQAEQPAERDFLPEEESKGDFNRAAQNADQSREQEGVSSQQVGDDQPEPTPPPPSDHQDQDRAAHAERMVKDENAVKETARDRHRAALQQRLQQPEGQDTQGWRQQDRGQDFDQSR